MLPPAVARRVPSGLNCTPSTMSGRSRAARKTWGKAIGKQLGKTIGKTFGKRNFPVPPSSRSDDSLVGESVGRGVGAEDPVEHHPDLDRPVPRRKVRSKAENVRSFDRCSDGAWRLARLRREGGGGTCLCRPRSPASRRTARRKATSPFAPAPLSAARGRRARGREVSCWCSKNC